MEGKGHALGDVLVRPRCKLAVTSLLIASERNRRHDHNDHPISGCAVVERRELEGCGLARAGWQQDEQVRAWGGEVDAANRVALAGTGRPHEAGPTGDERINRTVLWRSPKARRNGVLNDALIS